MHPGQTGPRRRFLLGAEAVRNRWGTWLGTALLLLAAWQSLPVLQAYSTGLVNSGDGSVSIVDIPASPPGNPRPLVFCTAGDQTVTAGSNGDVTITCYNGLGHTIDLSIAYASSPATANPPTYTPASPLTVTVATDSSASTTLTVQTTLDTTTGTYTLSYSAQISTPPSVAVTFSFSSTVTVN